MSAREELLGLALRCEQASGADRELDAAIALAIGMIPRRATQVDGDVIWCGAIGFGVPTYTASLDAAMTLVPEGWFTKIALEDRHSHSWRWILRGGFGIESAARAATPALALCAAALKAAAAGGE